MWGEQSYHFIVLKSAAWTFSSNFLSLQVQKCLKVIGHSGVLLLFSAHKLLNNLEKMD